MEYALNVALGASKLESEFWFIYTYEWQLVGAF
jgi:hypothetical protein